MRTMHPRSGGWLLPLVVVVVCMVGSGAESQKQQADNLVPPHHPGGDLPTPSVWGPQEVETWLFAEGFGFLRKPFEDAQVNGRKLLAMREHTLDVDFNLAPSERCTQFVAWFYPSFSSLALAVPLQRKDI